MDSKTNMELYKTVLEHIQAMTDAKGKVSAKDALSMAVCVAYDLDEIARKVYFAGEAPTSLRPYIEKAKRCVA